MPLNVWVLVLAQALSLSVAPLVVLVGGLVGQELSPDSRLATLPIALIVVGTAIGIAPTSALMKNLGRRRVFIGGALLSSLTSLCAAWSLGIGSFTGFCLACTLLGFTIAIAQQSRFAAMESVSDELAGVAASRVLLGGLVAAFLGPELVVYGDWLNPWVSANAITEAATYRGAFVLLAFLALLAALILALGYRNTLIADTAQSGRPRPWADILSNPRLWLAIGAGAIGYAMMAFMMTATPLNMHHVDGHSLIDTKWVIQSHIIAMFLPSFFSGHLVKRWGAPQVILLGLTAYLVTIGIGLMGQQLMHYWGALVILGIGWNFLFVAGTSLLPQCHRPNERFQVQFINDLCVFGLQAIGALASGWVVFTFGWAKLLLICLVLIALVGTLLEIDRRTHTPATAS